MHQMPLGVDKKQQLFFVSAHWMIKLKLIKIQTS